MWFVAIGVALLVMQFAGIGPVGAWTWRDDWWLLLMPFGLAIAWWGWADASGLTKRKAMERIDAKKEDRRQKSMERLGIAPKDKRRR